jgi:uncharacterized protein YbjT (DUF2867 family)
MASQVALAEGVKHIVKLSTLDVQQNVGTGVWHARGELEIRKSGIGFTFVQPAGFMDNALFWASSIKAEGVVRSATDSGKIAFIHPKDIADVVTIALTMRKYDGMSLPISGRESLSYPEMVAKIGEVIGKSLKFESLFDEDEKMKLMDQGESSETIEYHLSLFRAIRAGQMERVTDTVERILERSPITFDQWIIEHVDAFC